MNTCAFPPVRGKVSGKSWKLSGYQEQMAMKLLWVKESLVAAPTPPSLSTPVTYIEVCLAPSTTDSPGQEKPQDHVS